MFLSTPYYDGDGNLAVDLEPPPEALREQFEEFFASYEMEDVIFHPDSEPTLRPKPSRVCRFCGKSMPDVKFVSAAHTIPQLTGNKYLISDFECDTCNNHFSLYESSLGTFLGVSRTLTTLRGQSGIPAYKSPDKKFEIWWEAGEKKIRAALDIGFENYYKIDRKKKLLFIFAIKQSYVPLYVFKSLLKIGLCYVDPADLPFFDRAMRLIRDESLNHHVTGVDFFKGHFYFFGGIPLPFPLIFCFKRKDDSRIANCPKYYFAVYFGNYIVQWAMPLFDPDESIFLAAGKVNVPNCPPLLGKTVLDIVGIPRLKTVDLSSDQLVKYEKDEIVMSFTEIHRPLASRIKNLYYLIKFRLLQLFQGE